MYPATTITTTDSGNNFEANNNNGGNAADNNSSGSFDDDPTSEEFKAMVMSARSPPSTGTDPSNRHGGDLRLSVVSQQYDTGNKGYLTESEQQMRNMDQGNHGYLTNAQVAQVVEQTMELRNSNLQLRNWVLGLFGAVVILGLSNLGTAFAAARLAKDTEADSTTGELTVKGDSSKLIRTQGKGVTVTTSVQRNTEQGEILCVKTIELVQLVNENAESVPSALVMEQDVGTDNESVSTFGFARSGTYVNSTHVVVSQDGTKEQIVFDLTSTVCDDMRRQRQRQLEQQEKQEKQQQYRQQQQVSDGYWTFFRKLSPHLRPDFSDEEHERHLSLTVVVDSDLGGGDGGSTSENVGQKVSSP